MRGSGRKRLAVGAVILLAAAIAVALATAGFGLSAPASKQVVGVAAVPLGKQLSNPSGWQTAAATADDISLLGTYDDSGPAAWDPSQHPDVFVTTVGVGYGGFTSTNNHPGIVLIDAKTKQIVAWRTYDLGLKTYNESHGLGVSPNGKWIYLPTGDVEKASAGHAGRTLVINAKTLRVHQVIQTLGMPHHFKSFTRADGKQLVMGEDFSWRNKANVTQSGSGVYILDPNADNEVVGYVNIAQLQMRPYLAFASPNGKYLSIGLSRTRDPDRTLEGNGDWAIVDTSTMMPIKYFQGGKDPVWSAFTPDNKYDVVCDAGSNSVTKINMATWKVVGESNSAVNGPYGCHFGWSPNQLWLIDKGESASNRGKNVGLVDTALMKPIDIYNTGCLRGDHGTVDPVPGVDELWITCNSSFEVAVFDMGKKKVTARIPMPLGGSTHSGAFVHYSPDFGGQVLADQNGLHGPALQRQQQDWAKQAS